MTGPTTSATTPAYTMIFDQSAHLDWDWIRTFAQNYWYYTDDHGVNDIIASGSRRRRTRRRGGAYYYTVCEMGFFRRFIEVNPNQIAAIKKLGDNFQVISGGVTSPDCLVCSGEGFVRNYLVGQTWLKATLGMTPKPQCWLPDDFGQGPDAAGAADRVGFRRHGVFAPARHLELPEHHAAEPACRQRARFHLDGVGRLQRDRALADQQLWLRQPVVPCLDQPAHDPGAINNFIAAYGPNSATPPAYSGAVTPYMYIPIDDDFSMPIEGLANDITGWNDNSVPVGRGREQRHRGARHVRPVHHRAEIAVAGSRNLRITARPTGPAITQAGLN